MSKYYAVKAGKKPGIYRTWAEAEKQVRGFSGAKFKSFTTEAEALSFINGGGNSKALENESVHRFQAYVDGSFNKHRQQYGSGVVVLDNQTVIEKLSVTGKDARYLDSFQIAGEVFACLEAIKWAKQNNVTGITICYDYQGIESWATKEWKTNKPISIDYVTQFDELSQGIDVVFQKVKGHSGDTYNDLADELAGSAANA